MFSGNRSQNLIPNLVTAKRCAARGTDQSASYSCGWHLMYHVSHVSRPLSKFMGPRGGSYGPTGFVDSARAVENK